MNIVRCPECGSRAVWKSYDSIEFVWVNRVPNRRFSHTSPGRELEFVCSECSHVWEVGA